MTTRRPDPDHCVNGHDLRVCGTFVESGKARCRACHRARCRKAGKALRGRRAGIMGRPMGDKQAGTGSAGDG